MTDITHFYLAMGYCVFLLVLGWVLLKFPPKKINYIYGYRTRRSMRNQDTWDEGNRYSGRQMIKLCLLSLLFPLLFYYLLPGYNLLLTVVLNTLLIVSIYWTTESHLKSVFDEEGNRIQK